MSTILNFVPEIKKMQEPGLPDKEIRRLQTEVRQIWKKKMSEDFMRSLYELFLTNLDLFLKDQSNGPELYYFVEIFSSGKFFKNGADLTGLNILTEKNDLLLEKIDKLIKLKDFAIVERQPHRVFKVRGNLGDMVCNIMEIYFYHPTYSYPAALERLKKSIVPFIFPFLKAFPWNPSNLIESFIEYSEDPVELYSEIIEFYLKKKSNQQENNQQPDDKEAGLLANIALDMMSLYVDSKDFAYKKGPKVVEKLINNKEIWNESTIDYFIEMMFFYPLRIPVSIKQQIEEFKENLEFYEKRKKEGTLSKYAKESFEKTKVRLELIKTDPEKFMNQVFLEASKKAAVSKNIFKCIEMTAKAFPHGKYSEEFARLLKETEEFKERPKKFPLNQKPEVVFKDLHFKLLVIEELMYKQKKLHPTFDIREFAEEYTKREISVEDDGYEIIPEALKYFKQLNIPKEELKQVTEIYHDCGVDGGSEFLNQLWPFWDPGCGDDILPLSNKAIDDLEHLPNLKKMTGLEHSKPSKKLVEAFKNKGVELVEQRV